MTRLLKQPLERWAIADCLDLVTPLIPQQRPSRSRAAALNQKQHPLGRNLIFLVLATRHDLQRIIRQWPLQRLRLFPRRAHPDIALFVRRQDHRHGLRMDRLDDCVRLAIKAAVARQVFRAELSSLSQAYIRLATYS